MPPRTLENVNHARAVREDYLVDCDGVAVKSDVA